MQHFKPKVTPWSIDEADFPGGRSLRDKLQFLVGYAILAPSSHNSQPWCFRVYDDAIDIHIDLARWLRVADEDQRELHISIGCAVENVLVAAEHFGLSHTLTLMPDRSDPLLAARVTMSEGGSTTQHRHSILFDMLTVRHTNHSRYDGHPIPEDIRERLRACCVEPEIVVQLTDDPIIKRSVEEWVVKGDAIQFAKPEFREELAEWIGRGVFGSSWLMSKLGQLAVSHFDMGKSIGKKDSDLLMSSPVFGLLASQSDGRPQQIRVGLAYQRISLLAASHGIWCQPHSQLCEVPEFKQELMLAAPEGGLIPQHPFRMGFAEPAEHTPRRPLEEVCRVAI